MTFDRSLKSQKLEVFVVFFVLLHNEQEHRKQTKITFVFVHFLLNHETCLCHDKSLSGKT